jgi:23S rRNA pseudouridine1911/1915/1917 synthase
VNKIEVIYENDNFLVVNKPAGVLVYLPLGAKKEETVREMLADKLSFKGKDERSGIVHRLDRLTSGLLIVAKNADSEKALKEMFKKRRVTKKYLTLVYGKLTPPQGEINIPLGRGSKERLKVVPTHFGKDSITRYKVLEYYPNNDMSLVEADLLTGRTHQIRVHFSAIGHSVVGDKDYSRKKSNLYRQFLHAATIEFDLPELGGHYKFESELPEELSQFKNTLS